MPLRLGASSCLLGEPVRFDGGHCRSRFVIEELGSFVEFVSVCPEQEVGMSTPRPTLRLLSTGDTAKSPAQTRMVTSKAGEDWTDRMHQFAEARVDALRAPGLDGYVLKKDSPSCGLERLKVYLDNGHSSRRDGVGHFTRVLQERWPTLPLEEEGRLNDPLLRANFLEQIWSRNRLRVLLSGPRRRRDLIAFHTAHKLLLRVHDEALYQELGRLVAGAAELEDEVLYARYEELFSRALHRLPTVGRHVNAMQHVLGYLKERLSSAEKRQMLGQIEDYRAGILPLMAPLSTLAFLIERYEVEYVQGQLYLEPYPKSLAARRRL